MALDRLDGVAVGGLAVLIAASLVLDAVVVAAMVGGFVLSIALWRLYDGRPWEALGWLSLVGAAVTLVFGLEHLPVLVAFLGFVLIGTFLLLGSRFDLLLDVWTVENDG